MRGVAVFVLVIAGALLVSRLSSAQPAPFRTLDPLQEKPGRLDYRPGAPVPAGYHIESKVRLGPLVTGSILGGLGYALGVSTIASEGCSADFWLWLPAAGPFVALAVAPEQPASGPCDDPEGVHHGIRVMSGIGQGVGSFLIFVSVAARRQYLVADDASAARDAAVGRSWAVVPAVGPSSAGVAMVGTF
jgi:hypothetical protein